MKVLVVEDDKKLAEIIEKGLKKQGFRVDVASEAEEGLYLAKNNSYDVMIIDWMLPKKSGIELIKELRKENILTPTLILTAKSDIDDKVEGLSVADDYLTKPFEFDELIARLKALFRRSKKLPENIIKIDDLEMNLDTKEVKRGGKPIELTAKQFELLKLLMVNKNKLVTPKMIEENLWEMNEERDSNVITAHLSYLRKKIDKGFDKQLIKTIRGMGYKISDE